MNSPCLPKDRDFIETPEGMFFCVVDYLHPPGKYTAYLKYSPAPSGRWQRGGTAYRRELAFYHAHQVGQTLDYLQANHPHYLDYCPVRDMRFSMIPHDRVAHYYRPQTRLVEVMGSPRDPLEEDVAALAADLEAAGIPLAQVGISGSILLGIHNEAFSDIDLTIYGREAVDRLAVALAAGRVPGIGPIDQDWLAGWRREIADHHGLTPAQIDWLVTRRWNFAYYRGRRYLSLHPVRSDAEIRERYGDHTYRDAGDCRLRAVVRDATEAIYLPAHYAIGDVAILEGPQVEIQQICCHEGLFGQVADEGQVIEARGKLEQMDGGARHRLVIGSSHRSGREYLLPAEL